MTSIHGAIDVDFHLPAPAVADLVPHLDDYWADQVVRRNIDTAPFALTSYPPNAPITCRPDWKGEDPLVALDRFGCAVSVANILHGVVTLANPDMAAALTAAVNDHMAGWLDRDARLRGTILLQTEDIALAVNEIDRLAPDPRFVQVMLLAMLEAPHGNRRFWPIYEAAERHGLTLAIHAGGLYRHAPSVAGWPSYQFEDYVQQALAFENITLSLLAEGVFQKFPGLKVVFLESGFGWLPTTMWRIDKTWRGVRAEVPWIDRKPTEVLAGRLFVSLQPVDLPDAKSLEQSIRLSGMPGMLVFSTDYPHRQFAGDDPLPQGLPERLIPGILRGHALAAYPRLAADPALAPALETAT